MRFIPHSYSLVSAMSEQPVTVSVPKLIINFLDEETREVSLTLDSISILKRY